MKGPDSATLSESQQRQCDIRLENDTSALEAAASERMQVRVARFGGRPLDIRLRFPLVRTAFFDRPSGEVKIARCGVEAEISPNAAGSFPYPLGSPTVRIFYPDLRQGRVPWLGGLLWFQGDCLHGSRPHRLPDGMRRLAERAFGFSGHDGMGMPCLWREGGWSRRCDLIFCARQIHRLLTDPRDYSPGDSLNPEAAVYWATRRDLLPLEPPLPQLLRKVGQPPDAAAGAKRFDLTEVL